MLFYPFDEGFVCGSAVITRNFVDNIGCEPHCEERRSDLGFGEKVPNGSL